MLHVVTSPSAAARIERASHFLTAYPPGTELLIIGASRAAADDLARAIALRTGATFGLTRLSLTELAARAERVRWWPRRLTVPGRPSLTARRWCYFPRELSVAASTRNRGGNTTSPQTGAF